MRKTVTPVISVVLLTLVTVAATILAFVWINSLQANVQENAGTSISDSSTGGCSRLQVISMRGDGVTVSNVGCDTVESVTLLIDGELTSYDLNSPLSPGEAGTITFGNLVKGSEHCVSIVLSNGRVVQQCTSAGDATAEAGFTDECTEDSECISSNPCKNGSCVGGVCSFTNFPNGPKTGCTGSTGCSGSNCECVNGACIDTTLSGFCGDDVCGQGETSESCPEDCTLNFGVAFTGSLEKVTGTYNGTSINWGVEDYELFSGTRPDVAVDSNGTIWVVYFKSDTDSLYIRHSLYDSTTIWSSEEQLTSPGSLTDYPSITIDDEDNIWVAYTAGGQDITVINSTDGSTWSTPKTIIGATHNYPSISQTSNGYGIMLIDVAGSSLIWADSSDGVNWNTEVVQTAFTATNSDLIMDESGNLYSSFIDSMSSAYFKKSTNNGASWTSLTDSTGRYVEMPLIKNNNGNIVGLYRALCGADDCAYLYYSIDGTNFETYGPVSGILPSADLGFVQLPKNDYVMFYSISGSIYVDHLNIIDSGSQVSTPSWVMDDNGVIHMSYVDNDGNIKIFYRNSTDGLIFSEPVLAMETTGDLDIFSNNMIIDNSGVCRIVGADYMGGGLYVSKSTTCADYDSYNENGYIWESGDLNLYPTLIQDDNDLYWIAYSDNSESNIKIMNSTVFDDESYWSEPRIIAGDFSEPHLLQDNNGKYWIVMGKAGDDCYIMNSNDALTWSAPQAISEAPTFDCHAPVLIQDDGYKYHLFYSDEGSDIRHASSNDGSSWTYHGIIFPSFADFHTVFNWIN